MLVQVLAIVIPIVCTVIFALIGYAVVQSVGRLTDKIKTIDEKINKHVDECDSHVSNAVLDTRLKAAESEVVGLRKFSHWIGNSIMAVAAKVPGVILPPRPE